ncbi:IclR family transcriptional regulator [Actinomycetospora lemnae]|uniref:IclR family transcriptional regulator n=1 Tax=Actinomycetospora lemnae TaxID=3019891 RepID=A0ABT5SME6_9PSEU|nr:IclR family transcriptional regulator [Actinomycetospora sp. DW7H6]MDD7963997.1 IclR family transcriptional regulator [Actinomycetospora sp. DW7H6]
MTVTHDRGRSTRPVRDPERVSTGPVVARALRLLEAFSDDRPTLTLSEISRRSGVPLSTAHRLVTELEVWGAVERDAGGRYQIGLRLWEVGALAPRGPGLRERALPYLEDLCAVTRENVQLAVREDDEIVFVERLAGSRAVGVLTRVGGRWAMTATGVGLVLLAHAPADVVERVLEGPFTRHTPYTLADPVRIREMLAAIRTCGYAVSERQITDDATSVAAPIRDAGGEVVAALSVVAHHDNPPVSVLAPLVRTSAAGVSHALAAGRRPRRAAPPAP